jgi:hypothetical protein
MIIQSHLSKPGFLVLGMHEEFPPKIDGFIRPSVSLPIYQRA